MKSRYSFTLAAALILFGATSVFAQPPATQTKPATSTAAVDVPKGKVAIIFSAVFQDQKQGITKFTVLLTKLNGEFQKLQEDLNLTAQKINALQEEIKKLQQSTAPVDPKSVQAKVDQLDQMKKDYQRRGEDGQAAYQQRRKDLFLPLQEEVGKALDTYAKSRGVTLVIDASQTEGILYAAEIIDITRAFISDYNSKNPATAAVTTPK
ncbi:MAG: OmpH family outer membrane protein [Pyrinomonadaceae bacterium]